MAQQRDAFGPFVLDRAAGLVRRDGEPVALGQRGFALLDALLSADGQAVSKDQLLARAWPGVIVEEANLSVQIAALRKALGRAPNGLEWIATVPRIGYRLPHPNAPETPPRPVRPSIAVLPFENLSSDADISLKGWSKTSSSPCRASRRLPSEPCHEPTAHFSLREWADLPPHHPDSAE